MDNNILTQVGIWANVFSAIFTMAAAIIAFSALNQWRNQYEENKFLRFIDSVIEYNNCLIRAPKSIKDDIDNVHRKALSVAGNEMNMRWLICLKIKRVRQNKQLIDAMQTTYSKHIAFLSGEITKLELAVDQIVTIALHAN